MTNRTFSKRLTANDVGSTGGHQGGILVPRTEGELLAFLPPLDPNVKNPDAWIECEDETGTVRKFRFVYYNNKFHDDGGTRNEYRITCMTKYFREVGAREGEQLEISRHGTSSIYNIRMVRTIVHHGNQEESDGFRIKITSGWRRVH
jgi:hypothetical protein